MMKPFLYNIAEVYFKEEAKTLADICFVFPSKRAATFFNHYLSEVAAKNTAGRPRPLLHPATRSIVEFCESFAEGNAPAERLEMTFMLYDAYRKVTARRSDGKQPDVDFNRFVYWADTLLQDFDDVDNAMANPAEIFRNVSTLKEISANYLTAEQVEEIKHYWKDFDLHPDVQHFWNHINYSPAPTQRNSDKQSPTAGFLRLWQVMGDIYTEFRNELRNRQLYTPGMNARRTAEFVATATAEDFPFSRYVFVGFNSLSVAERNIFSRLAEIPSADGKRKMADFYWDPGPALFANDSVPGLSLVHHYASIYPSFYPCVKPVESFPQVNIAGIPSRVGQCKAIGNLLNKMFPETPPQEQLRSTAIVLPDENLLTPLVNSIPQNITALNVTMGFKLRNTAVAGLMRNIISLQMRSYRSDSKQTFFVDDVTAILTHPLVRAVDAATAAAMQLEIKQKRLFNVPGSFFQTEQYRVFAPIFTPVADKQQSSDVFTYLRTLLAWLGNAITEWDIFTTNLDDTPGDDPSAALHTTLGQQLTEAERNFSAIPHVKPEHHSAALQRAFIRRYANAVMRLQKLRDRYLQPGHLFLEDATVFHLVERVVNGEMLNFEGKPLRGLQIMGVLEARALDFDTIVIPSMNERIFHRSKFGASFIPNAIRKAYHLNTAEDQEGAFAYYFYRMIARASKVYLLYDARSTGLNSSGPSRFIRQLQYIVKPPSLTSTVIPYRLSTFNRPEITVEKTPETMRKIERYRSAENPAYLSPTSIENYLNCPLSFYLERIAGFRDDDRDMLDWIDEGTYGDIVHSVFENLFNRELSRSHTSEGVTLSSRRLIEMARDTIAIDREITRAINKCYRNLGDNNDTPLTNDTAILARIIRMFVEETLKFDATMAPFTYMASEWTRRTQLILRGEDGKEMTINLNFKIDRLDWLKSDAAFPRLRAVDYKTGGDSLAAKSVEQVATADTKVKAFLQLMLYCQAYAQTEGYDGPIQPIIYSMHAMMKGHPQALTWVEPAAANTGELEHRELKQDGKKWLLLDYRDYRAEFNSALIDKLGELFNPDIPFKPAADSKACKYCKFQQICQTEFKPY